MNIGKGSLFTVERDEFESDTLTALADFLSVKTADWQRQIAHNPLDKRGFSTSRTSGKQNSFGHVKRAILPATLLLGQLGSSGEQKVR